MAAREINPDVTPLAQDAPMSPEMVELVTRYMSGPGGLKDAAKARGMYMYYRQPNGDITLSPAFITDMMRYMMEGWLPLAKYGRIKLGLYYHERPYEYLLSRGGVVEFTKEQATELRFHLDPPKVPTCRLAVGAPEPFWFQESRNRDELLPNRLHAHDAECFEDSEPIVFPQFADGVPQVFGCHFCDDIHVTKKALDNHIQVMHKDHIASHSTALALADAIRRAQEPV